MMERIESLLQEYSRSLPHEKKAELESAMWAATPPHERNKGGIGVHLSKILNASIYEISLRHSIWRLGAAGAPIWRELERQMTLGESRRIIQRAKRRAKREGKLSDAIVKEVNIFTDPGGMRPKAKKGRPPGKIGTDGESRDFWSSMRSAAVERFEEQLGEDFPHMERQRMIQNFLSDLDTVFRDHRARIKRAATSQEERRQISRRDLRSACQILNVPIPRVGRLPDMKAAKNKFRKLAREYHPDKNAGDEATSQLFNEVVEAWETLQSYKENMRESN